MAQQIMTIGSIYGEDQWKNLDMLEAMITDDSLTPTYDKYIFMGNYVKSYWRKQGDIGTMINELVSLKENYPDHIVLLTGRDDVQYLFPDESKFKIEGRHEDIVYYAELYQLLSTHLALSYYYGDNLWTHSGVNLEWASVFGITAADNASDIHDLLANIELGTSSQQYYMDTKVGGKNVASSPIFTMGVVDSRELIEWVNHIVTEDHQSKAYLNIKRTPFISTVCQLTEHKITDFYTRELEDSVLIQQYNE